MAHRSDFCLSPADTHNEKKKGTASCSCPHQHRKARGEAATAGHDTGPGDCHSRDAGLGGSHSS